MTPDVASFVSELRRRLLLPGPTAQAHVTSGGRPVPKEELPRLAEQLVWLFNNIPGPRGELMRTEDLARWCTDEAGVAIRTGYLASLRQGQQSNPSAVKLGAIARAFSVPTDFFLRPEIEEEVRSVVEQITREKRVEAERRIREVTARSSAEGARSPRPPQP